MRKSKANKITYLLPLFLILIPISLKLNSLLPKFENTTLSEIQDNEVVFDKGLSFPVSRVPSRSNFIGWKEYFVKEIGVSFYYPANWSVEGSTIQSWIQESVGRPRPLQGSEAKWDMGLTKLDPDPVNLEEAFMKDTDIKSMQNFEVSKTVSGKTVYFAEPIYEEEDTFSGSSYSVVAIIQTDTGFYRWFGHGPDPNHINSEILKQIVESIH